METPKQERDSSDPSTSPSPCSHASPHWMTPVPSALIPPTFEVQQAKDTLSSWDQTARNCSESFGHWVSQPDVEPPGDWGHLPPPSWLLQLTGTFRAFEGMESSLSQCL